MNITSDPNLDAKLNVKSPAFVDVGTPNIGPGLTLSAGKGLHGFLGAAPDVGANEQ